LLLLLLSLLHSLSLSLAYSLSLALFRSLTLTLFFSLSLQLSIILSPSLSLSLFFSLTNYIVTQVAEKNHVQLAQAFGRNLERLWRMSVKQQLEVIPGQYVNITVHYGGDESWLRTMLGLKKAVCTTLIKTFLTLCRKKDMRA
jgi:hypothetical protein